MTNFATLIKYIGIEMTIQEAIEARHSVRAYKEQPLTAEVVKALATMANDWC